MQFKLSRLCFQIPVQGPFPKWPKIPGISTYFYIVPIIYVLQFSPQFYGYVYWIEMEIFFIDKFDKILYFQKCLTDINGLCHKDKKYRN